MSAAYRSPDFNNVIVKAEDPFCVERNGVRAIHCEACETELGQIQNYIAHGTASITLTCPTCRLATLIELLASAPPHESPE